MSYILPIYALLVGLSAMISHYSYRRILTPPTMIALLWLLVFLAYETDKFLFHLFAIPVTQRAFLLHMLSLFCILGAAHAVMTLFRYQRPIANQSIVTAASIDILQKMIMLWLGLFAFMVLARASILEIHYQFHLPLFSVIREDFVSGKFKMPAWSNFSVVFANLAALLMGVLLAYRWRQLSTYLFIAILFALALTNDALIADKEGLRLAVMLGLSWFFAWTILKNKTFSVREMLATFLWIVFIFSLFSLITYLRIDAGHPYTILEITAHYYYVDIIGNFVSSSWFIDHPFRLGILGENSFNGLLSAVNVILNHLFHYTLIVNPISAHLESSHYAPIMVNGVFNTSDYIAFLVSDFGVSGVIFFSLLMGAVLGYFYSVAHRTHQISDLLLLSFMMTGVVILIRGFYFGGIGFWITLFALYALRHFCFIRSVPKQI